MFKSIYPPLRVRVKLGATHRNQTKGYQVVDSDRLIRHRGYIPELDPEHPEHDPDFSVSNTNDIGLIKLSEPAKLHSKESFKLNDTITSP